jgi:hypothetical protein
MVAEVAEGDALRVRVYDGFPLDAPMRCVYAVMRRRRRRWNSEVLSGMRVTETPPRTDVGCQTSRDAGVQRSRGAEKQGLPLL